MVKILTFIIYGTNMAYKTLNLANSFIELSLKGELYHLNSMKLQRLLFLTQAYSLQLYRDAMIDDAFVKWEYGPVIPSIYHRLKEYKAGNLTDYIYETKFKEGELDKVYYSSIAKKDKLSWEIIHYIANYYKEQKGSELSNLILQHDAWEKLGSIGDIINFEQIKMFYDPKKHLKLVSV